MEVNHSRDSKNLSTLEIQSFFRDLESCRHRIYTLLDSDSEKKISSDEILVIIDLLPEEMQSEFLTHYQNLKSLQEDDSYEGNPELSVFFSIETRLNQIIITLSDYLVHNEKILTPEEVDSTEDVIQRVQNILNEISNYSFRRRQECSSEPTYNSSEQVACLLVDDYLKDKNKDDTFAL